ncbi:MAG: hypothetical protein ABIR26_15755 [Ramlibacter sp.]
MNPFKSSGLAVNVVEINPYDPRPFVFTDIALCLRDSILATGCAAELCVNRVGPGSISLVLGALPLSANVVEQLHPRTAAIFNFEQLAGDSPAVGLDYERWMRDWVMVDYHSRNIEHLLRRNGSGQQAFELPIIPGPSMVFQPGAPAAKSVDVLFYGTMTERRARILRQLEAAGLTVEAVAGAYGNELAPALQRARLVLHIHFYETGLFPVARMLQPVANGIPVVCEGSVFSDSSDWSQSGIVFAPYDRLVDACHTLLAAPEQAAERARRSLDFSRELDFVTPFGQLVFAIATRAVHQGASAGPIAPPAQREAAARSHAGGDDRPLTTAEIEAILAEEAEHLPPEAHLGVAPLKIAEHTPGKGPHGFWIVLLLVLFSIFTIWQSMAAR